MSQLKTQDAVIDDLRREKRMLSDDVSPLCSASVSLIAVPQLNTANSSLQQMLDDQRKRYAACHCHKY